MSHMGRSGKTAVGAFFAALGMLVLTAITLEEAVLFTFLGLLAVGYVASVAEAFARRRYLALLVGAAGTSLFIGCGMAFLRMWGLAFTDTPSTLGRAVSTTDPDIYFYLAAAAGTVTLLVLFGAATWPGRRRAARPSRATVGQRRAAPSSAARSPAARRPAPQRQATQRQTPQRQATQRQPRQRQATQRQPSQHQVQRTQRPQRKTL
ncbi:hypothetical protein [Arthrobacter sp. D1-17]